MKTTFLAVLIAGLGILSVPQATHASSPPLLDKEGESLELAPAASLASAELQPGPATVAGRNVNVRAKATTGSEVIVQVQDGDVVFVEQVIVRKDATAKDPARWAKIAYPTNATAWVHSRYLDAAAGTVKARKLNVRSRPGENFTIVGTLQSGDAVKSLGSKGDWVQIEPPAGATAYIAAKLLRQAAPPEAPIAGADTKPAETQLVNEGPAVAEGAAPEVVAVQPAPETVEGATRVTDTTGAQGATDLAPLPEEVPVVEQVPAEPLPPRIVDREGIVRSFTSIQAPSFYKLVSPDNGRIINYIHTDSTNLDLGRYVGLHIIATGEESLDARWRNTPVLTLNRIVLVE
ncbi:MAG: SH3 domain-containing protein [Verrucomicrobia bacterium]|jgi:uncharacterized protein YgiM (DUF1202 family)|nr:SH3 domain-containing protein [Verrucomicrobiota bacterium]